MLKSRRDLDLDRTMPNVELVRAIFIYYNMFEVSSGLSHYFFSYRVHRQTERHTDRQTDRQTHIHTDKHEYSIVAVNKPQLIMRMCSPHNPSLWRGGRI